jgi:hypothetical protein
MEYRRIGKFYVPISMTRQENFALILAKLQFVPLRVECLYYADKFEYIGTSPLFDEAERGILVPEYTVTVNEENEEVTVSVAKMIA